MAERQRARTSADLLSVQPEQVRPKVWTVVLSRGSTRYWLPCQLTRSQARAAAIAIAELVNGAGDQVAELVAGQLELL